jgi:hypothetical protein
MRSSAFFTPEKEKREPVGGKQIEHTKSNLLLSLSMHTLVIIICIQNERERGRESNMSGEKRRKKCYI